MSRLVARLALLAALAAPLPAAAQLVPSDTLRPPPNTETLDLRAFRAIYEADSSASDVVLQQTNSASSKIFLAAIPVSAAATALAGEGWRPPARLALSSALTLGATYALKGSLRRPRPCAALAGVTSRTERCPTFDVFSFPSGHASYSFALATSTSLSYPHWYVVAPAMTWATLTSLARVWHGVHYPSDVAVGAALGAGMAVLVHLLLPSGDGDASGADAVVVPLTLTF